MTLAELKQLVDKLDTELIDKDIEIIFENVYKEDFYNICNASLKDIRDPTYKTKVKKYLVFY